VLNVCNPGQELVRSPGLKMVNKTLLRVFLQNRILVSRGEFQPAEFAAKNLCKNHVKSR